MSQFNQEKIAQNKGNSTVDSKQYIDGLSYNLGKKKARIRMAPES